MATESIAAALLVFAGAAASTIYFGVRITLLADRIATVTGIGHALVGAIFLGAVTSIAEIGTSLTAAIEGHAELAVNNAAGSIAAQTAIIALADLSYRRANLEHDAASVSNLLLIASLMVLITILMLAVSTPTVALWFVHPASVLMFAVYVFCLRIVAHGGEIPMWRPRHLPRIEVQSERQPPAGGHSASSLWPRFVVLAVILAASGYLLAESGIALARLSGLSETVVGALLTGVTSSMPELVTAVTAVRIGSLTLAVSNIVGGNAFDTLIIAAADFAYVRGSIYADAGTGVIVLLAATLLMNAVALLGMLARQRHGPANIGLEGVLLLGIYCALVVWLTTFGSAA